MRLKAIGPLIEPSCALSGLPSALARELLHGLFMKMRAMGLAMALSVLPLMPLMGGCATTTQPLVVSDQQKAHFNEVVREAEEGGAFVDGEQRAAQLLADAKSDFEFAQHLPSAPDRARDVLSKAQAEAELALQLVRRERAAIRAQAKPALVAGETAH